MAHKKGGGVSRNGRDSCGQRLGVGRGRGDTLFALVAGVVRFERLDQHRQQVSVYPA